MEIYGGKLKLYFIFAIIVTIIMIVYMPCLQENKRDSPNDFFTAD
jgi:hypothetical protein